MRAYLIDPTNETVTEVDYDGNYKSISRLIGCDYFTTVVLTRTEDGWPADTLFVDDEGLFVEDQRYFTIRGYNQPLAGKGLVLGTDAEGDSIEPDMDLATAQGLVRFLSEGVHFEPKPPEVTFFDSHDELMEYLKAKR